MMEGIQTGTYNMLPDNLSFPPPPVYLSAYLSVERVMIESTETTGISLLSLYNLFPSSSCLVVCICLC